MPRVDKIKEGEATLVFAVSKVRKYETAMLFYLNSIEDVHNLI